MKRVLEIGNLIVEAEVKCKADLAVEVKKEKENLKAEVPHVM